MAVAMVMAIGGYALPSRGKVKLADHFPGGWFPVADSPALRQRPPHAGPLGIGREPRD